MILVRDQFQTRYGRVEELLALFRRFRGMYAGEKTFQGVRVLTDALAPLNTVTTEYIVESVNAYYDWARERYPSTEFKVWFNQMLACTDSGTRELYEFVTPYQNLRGAPGHLMVRNVYHARYGKADFLCEHLQRESALAPRYHIPPVGIMTDLSGPMFTIVTTRDYPSLAAYEKGMETIMTVPEYSEWRRGLLVAVETGRREVYRIEE